MSSAASSRFSIHTITNKPWSGAECVRRYAGAGIGGITFWRHDFQQTPAAELGRLAREEGLTVTGLARGGFFPALDLAGRQAAIEDNLHAIDEARECGAPVLVLVCGAVPGLPLADARQQIATGIHAVLSHARAAGVRLAIEPLHPMYADSRSAIVTVGQANEVCDWLGSPPEVGIAVDVYHTWWDASLESEIQRAGQAGRLFSFHVCDWKTPTTDLLNDRGLMGEGCIPIRRLRRTMESAGFSGFSEVEIFSTRYWEMDQATYLEKIVTACHEHC